MAESFFSTLSASCSTSTPGRRVASWPAAVFEWIEGWHNPRRRHSSIGDPSPIDYEARLTPAAAAA